MINITCILRYPMLLTSLANLQEQAFHDPSLTKSTISVAENCNSVKKNLL